MTKQLDELLPVSLTTDKAGLYIHATMPDGSRNMIFDIRVRGWGNLTGGGARNLDENTAMAVQKMWADEMCARWNKADLVSKPEITLDDSNFPIGKKPTELTDERIREALVDLDISTEKHDVAAKMAIETIRQALQERQAMMDCINDLAAIVVKQTGRIPAYMKHADTIKLARGTK